jgi:hypothetical protein
VLTCYLQLERILSAANYPRPAGATVEQFAEILAADALSTHKAAWMMLTGAFSFARYSEEDMPISTAQQVYAAYVAIEKSLGRKKPGPNHGE